MLNNSKKAPVKTERGFTDGFGNKIDIVYTIYSRVSTDTEEQQISVMYQLEQVREQGKKLEKKYSNFRKYKTEYGDNGKSGTNVLNREEFKCMIEEAKKPNTFNLILIRDVSRFARNIRDFIDYTHDLKKFGVAVLFLEYDVLSTDDNSDFLLMNLAIQAQQESAKKRKYTLDGHKARRDKGFVFGANDKFGYTLVKTSKDHSNKLIACKKNELTGMNEEKIVKLIFDLYTGEKTLNSSYKKQLDGGYGITEIVKYLNAMSYKTKKGKDWGKSSVANIINNKTYCGYIRYNTSFKTELSAERSKQRNKAEYKYVKSDKVEVIISEEQYKKARNLAITRQTYAQKPKYDEQGNVIYDEDGNMVLECLEYLTDEQGRLVHDEEGRPVYKFKGYRVSNDKYSRVLQCECASVMRHHYLRKADSNGRRAKGYSCYRYDKGLCKNGLIDRIRLDMLTFKVYESIWGDQDVYEDLYKIIEKNIKNEKEKSGIDEEIKELSIQLRRIDDKISNLLELSISAASLNPTVFDEKNKQLTLERSKYENKLAQLQAQKGNIGKTPDNILEKVRKFFETNFIEDTDSTYGYKIVSDAFIQNCIEKIVSHKDGSFDYYISLTGVSHISYKNKFGGDYAHRYIIPQNAMLVEKIEIPYEEANEFAKKQANRVHGFLKTHWKPLIANIYII